ncbi:MLP-like protein 328 [Punica granatum]|nr:MLP-like protein 328 [Punica granatum]
MAIEGKVEAELELKSTPDMYFKRLKSEIHHAPNASSDKIHAIEVHEGDWETPGSVKLWTYTIDGRKETFKEKIEVDDQTKTVSMVAVGGHVLDRYKNYKLCVQIVPQENRAVAKISITVEKNDADVPDPHDYLQHAISVAKDIDEHLVAQS